MMTAETGQQGEHVSVQTDAEAEAFNAYIATVSMGDTVLARLLREQDGILNVGLSIHRRGEQISDNTHARLNELSEKIEDRILQIEVIRYKAGEDNDYFLLLTALSDAEVAVKEDPNPQNKANLKTMEAVVKQYEHSITRRTPPPSV